MTLDLALGRYYHVGDLKNNYKRFLVQLERCLRRPIVIYRVIQA